MEFGNIYPILGLSKLFLSFIVFFLSIRIIVPAPKSFLLPLSVGMPEISPWLTSVSSISFFLGIISFQPNILSTLIVLFSLIALTLSLLPLIQLPKVINDFEGKMEASLGINYLKIIPDSIKAKMRPSPLIFRDLFTGIVIPQVRITRGVTFAQPDDIELKLNLYRPLTQGNYPTVIIIYGGSWRSGSPDNNEKFSCYLANQGYTVIAIDYRHAPQYRFPCQLEDVKRAFQYIKQNALELEVNLDKIAITGLKHFFEKKQPQTYS